LSNKELTNDPFNVVASSNFTDEFPLERIHLGVELKHTKAMLNNSPTCLNSAEEKTNYIAKLRHAELAEFGGAAVGGLRLQEHLAQGHLLTPEERSHAWFSELNSDINFPGCADNVTGTTKYHKSGEESGKV